FLHNHIISSLFIILETGVKRKSFLVHAVTELSSGNGSVAAFEPAYTIGNGILGHNCSSAHGNNPRHNCRHSSSRSKSKFKRKSITVFNGPGEINRLRIFNGKYEFEPVEVPAEKEYIGQKH